MDLLQDVERIKRAETLHDIQKVVLSYSARPCGDGALLYSGAIGKTHSNSLALEHASRMHSSIIDNTPRGRFLSEKVTNAAIKEASFRIFESQGFGSGLAEKLRDDFLYGDANAPAHSPTSIQNCLWWESTALKR